MLVGLLTPLAGLIITCNMVVAIAVSSGQNGFIAPGRLGYEYNLVLIAIALAIAGPGRLSLDHQLGLDQAIADHVRRLRQNITDEYGISVGDFASAIIDALEDGSFARERFSVAY